MASPASGKESEDGPSDQDPCPDSQRAPRATWDVRPVGPPPAFQTELQEWARLRELAAARNVDLGAKPAERAAQFIALARDAIQSLDGTVASALLTFHVRTG